MDVSQIKVLLSRTPTHYDYFDVMYQYRKGMKSGKDFSVIFRVDNNYFVQDFDKWGLPIGNLVKEDEHDFIDLYGDYDWF